jgi:hypothetical protein
MTELDLIASLRPEVPLPGETDLAAARSTLMRTLAFEPGGAAAQARSRRGRRAVLGAVAAAAVAVACAATFAVNAGSGSGNALARGHGLPVPATLTAVQFLTAAAAATRHMHVAPPPTPDQYVYSAGVQEPGAGSWREWLAADGSRPGVTEGPGQGGAVTLEPACTVAQAESTGCYLSAGYLPGLPVSASAVLAYLARLQLAAATPPPGQKTPNWLANDTGKAVEELMSSTYLLPAQEAGLFQLLARTPGFQIVRNAADALGRRGVGIYWFYQDSGAMIVFDPVTYRFLGFGTWGAGDVPGSGEIPRASDGVVKAPDGSALVAMTVVDRAPAPSVSQSSIQKLAALFRQARLWAARQRGHQQLTVGAGVAEYLREVQHMSPARVQQYMREFAQIYPFLCVRDAPQYLARARRRTSQPIRACPAT